MKAIVQDRYGSPAVLETRDIDKPEITDDEVLVRVHAASIHVGDWILMTGDPYVMRMATGLRKPKNPVPGTDVAGTVEAVGKDVKGFVRGDEVFGWAVGAFADTHERTRITSSRSRPTSHSSKRRLSACPRRPPFSSCVMTDTSSPGRRCSSMARQEGLARSLCRSPRRSAPT